MGTRRFYCFFDGGLGIPPLERGGKDKIMSNRRITESVVEEAALSRHQTSRLEVFFR